MALQQLPSVATDYAALQRNENGAAVAAALRLWKRMGNEFDASFIQIAPQLIDVMNTAQLRISQNAQAYIPEILDATGQSRANKPRLTIPENTFVGTAGNGLPTESLAYGAVIRAKTAVGKGTTTKEALAQGGQFMALSLGTMLSDTRRGMEGFETYSRPISGFVRQLTPPSCGRCVVLAGKWYRKNAGFARHPGCDCLGIPAAENVGGDMTTDPQEYLSSLDDQSLSKALGSQANAKAYSEYGADPFQIVNSYRGGIRKAQQYGRNIKYTTEGMTKRGLAYKQMQNVRALSRGPTAYESARRVIAPRLMPESILGLNLSQERTAQMLRDFGWLGTRAAPVRVATKVATASKATKVTKLAPRVPKPVPPMVAKAPVVDFGDVSKYARPANVPKPIDFGDITNTQFTAINSYTETETFREINNALRSGAKLDAPIAEKVAQIKSTMTSLTDDVLLERGFPVESIEKVSKLFGVDLDTAGDVRKLIGSSLDEAAFSSTSFVVGESGRGSVAAWSDVRMVVQAPKGTKAVNLTKLSKFPEENELLLQPGLRYTIADVHVLEGAGSTGRRVTLDVVTSPIG